MSHEHDLADANAADRGVSDWLDGVVGTEAAIESTDKRRMADLLWIQSLLEVSLCDVSTARNRRIDRVMSVIRRESARPADLIPVTASQPRRSARRTIIGWTAAVLLVCAGVWMQTWSPQRQVHAAVDQIRHSAAKLEDREYLVELIYGNSASSQPDDATRIVNATLFVRGGEAFVVKAPALLRTGDVWFGRDREGAWFKPAVGPVMAGSGAMVMQQKLLRDSQNPAPFLQITTILDRLADNYDVELLPRKRGSSPTVQQHVHGSLRSAASQPVWLPDQVDIQASSSGTVQRLLLSWTHEMPSGLKQMQFDFVQQSRQPDNWYRPESHIK